MKVGRSVLSVGSITLEEAFSLVAYNAEEIGLFNTAVM
jgi:hypothetical protein